MTTTTRWYPKYVMINIDRVNLCAEGGAVPAVCSNPAQSHFVEKFGALLVEQICGQAGQL